MGVGDAVLPVASQGLTLVFEAQLFGALNKSLSNLNSKKSKGIVVRPFKL